MWRSGAPKSRISLSRLKNVNVKTDMNIFRCLRRKGLVPQTSCPDCLPSFLPKCQPWSSEQGSCPQRWCMILMRSATPTWKKHSARRQGCRWCMVGRLRKRCWIVPPHVTACQSVCVHTATTSVFHVDSGSRCCQNRGKRQDVCRLVQSRPPIQWCEEEVLFTERTSELFWTYWNCCIAHTWCVAATLNRQHRRLPTYQRSSSPTEV